jgi:uncharacterized membrane protein YccC
MAVESSVPTWRHRGQGYPLPVASPSSPPSLPATLLRNLTVLRPLPPRRLGFALRAGICMGLPIFVGWLAADVAAGMLAAIGGFTSLYGSGRPYASRAVHLAVVALGFALAVGIGIAVAAVPWAIVPTVAAIAMVATWLCTALRVSPPGAYLFLLACAAGSAMPPLFDPLQAGALVLAAGSFAWLVHMAGALWAPRGPETAAVAAAGRALLGYIQAQDSSIEARSRQQAAMALHDAWQALVRFQPTALRPDSRLARLRGLNRELHLLFAEAMERRGRGQEVDDDLRDRAHTLTAQAANPPPARPHDATPLGHPGVREALAEAMRPHSTTRLVVARVGVAALVAGGIGAWLELERAYWAIAAAVLMLYQGLDWMNMLQRSFERLLGTWFGLLLAAAVLASGPNGWQLALVVMALQFCVEVLVVRNYAIAVLFITAAALTLASGGHPPADLGSYVLARGVDTVVGCAVALVVYQLMAPRAAAALIPGQLLRLFAAVAAVLPHLAGGTPASSAARQARRDLMHRSFALSRAYDAAMAAGRAPRQAAERQWPTIAAAQRLAYRVLSLAWALERIEGEAAVEAARSMFGSDGVARLRGALDSATRALRDGYPPVPGGQLPAALAGEMQDLLQCLRRDST